MDEPTEAHKRTGRDVDVQGCFKMEQLVRIVNASEI